MSVRLALELPTAPLQLRVMKATWINLHHDWRWETTSVHQFCHRCAPWSPISAADRSKEPVTLSEMQQLDEDTAAGAWE